MPDVTWRPPEPDPYVELADSAAHDAAIRARVEERTRRERAADVATWIGTLRDLAERAVPVSVSTSSGRAHRGSLAAVGIDHVALTLISGAIVLIALDTVRTVRLEPGQSSPVAMGDRERSQDRTLSEALQHVVEDQREIVLVLREVTDPLSGAVIGLGDDVLTLRVRGGDRGTLYIPLAAVCELIVAA